MEDRKRIIDNERKYKKTELGEIPVDWEVKLFKDISKVSQGLQIAISDRYKEKGANRYLYITIQYLNDINNQDNIYYIENPNPNVICNKEDILMTRTGNTGIVITDVEGVFHNNFFKINFNRDILDKNYLVYYLKSYKIQNLILRYAGSTTIPDLNHGDFYRIPVVIPLLKEQQKISAILSTVDEYIEQTDVLIEKTKELKKGLMQKLLTKGIGHTEFKKTEIGEIPKEWEVKKLGDVMKLCTNGISEAQNLQCKGIKVTRIETISEGVINENKVGWVDTKKDLSRYKLKIGDILFSNINSVSHIGKVAYVDKENDLYHGMNLLRIQSKEDIVLPKFLFICLSSYRMKKWFERNCKKAINQASLSQSDVKRAYIQIPPLQEQQKIASILSEVDNQIEQYEIKKEKLQNLKKGLMQKLLTGKIRVKI